MREYKKLSKTDIPLGYKYAIIDRDGYAWATKYKPTLVRERTYGYFFREYWADYAIDRRLIGKGFSVSDWQNSLIQIDDEKTNNK
jgi:hypothetical protein